MLLTLYKVGSKSVNVVSEMIKGRYLCTEKRKENKREREGERDVIVENVCHWNILLDTDGVSQAGYQSNYFLIQEQYHITFNPSGHGDARASVRQSRDHVSWQLSTLPVSDVTV